MKKFNIFVLLLIILFRSNILLFFNNVFCLFFVKNDYNEAEKMVLKSKIDYLEDEYNSLKSFNDNLGLYANYNYLVTRVVYKENYFYNSRVYISGGENKNFKKGMAVLNEKGLVGVIDQVENKMSRIKLLTDTDNISVSIRDSYGKLVYKDNKFKVVDISIYDDIKLNDLVYTTGFGNIKEKLYIGKVKEVNDNDIEKEIIIESEVLFNELNYLLVVGDL